MPTSREAAWRTESMQTNILYFSMECPPSVPHGRQLPVCLEALPPEGLIVNFDMKPPVCLEAPPPEGLIVNFDTDCSPARQPTQGSSDGLLLAFDWWTLMSCRSGGTRLQCEETVVWDLAPRTHTPDAQANMFTSSDSGLLSDSSCTSSSARSSAVTATEDSTSWSSPWSLSRKELSEPESVSSLQEGKWSQWMGTGAYPEDIDRLKVSPSHNHQRGFMTSGLPRIPYRSTDALLVTITVPCSAPCLSEKICRFWHCQ